MHVVTLEEFIERVVCEMPRLKRTLIDPDLEDPRPNTIILINGKEVSVLNGLKTKVEDGDKVVLIPVLHTG
jgi:molybdopterin converting factor small subunit